MGTSSGLKFLYLIIVCYLTVSCRLDDNQAKGTLGSQTPTNSPTITYSNQFTFTTGQTITPVTPSTNSTDLTYSISPPLPSGLEIDSSTGIISGTPTTPLAQNTFTISASNEGGTSNSSISIAVNFATTITATSDLGDSSPGDGICESGSGCTLRAAVEEANALIGVKTVIDLPAATYILNDNNLTITEELTINGAGIGVTIIDADDGTPLDNIITANTDKDLILKDLTLQNANSSSFGFKQGLGIFSVGDSLLELNSVEVKDISGTVGSFQGGGVSKIRGSLKLVDSTFNNISITGTSSYGGAVYANNTHLIIESSTISGNSCPNGFGGGIYITDNATFSISNSLISNNSSGNDGGGIWISSSGTISNSTFTNNATSGDGAAISIRTNGSVLTISNSLFSENSGSFDVHSYLLGHTIVNNSTFYNSTSRSGVYAEGGTASLDHITIKSNGIALNSYELSGAGAIDIKNSVIDAVTSCQITGGATINSFGYNIVSTAHCGFSQTGDLNSQVTNLAASAPANNGGPTNTIGLQGGSVAIDHIPVCSQTTDQRGFPRPVDKGGGPACDAGAFEVQ